VESPPPVLPTSTRSGFEATLDLATPAFLAGANQRGEDCDLRSATLRGLLRWWWRAMHSGFVDVASLRRMEAALWGDTDAGGAVRIELRPEGTITPLPYDRQAEARRNGLPKPPDRKTTQGLWYHSYGMNDGGRQRHYVKPGSRWKLVLTVREAPFVLLDAKGKPIRGSERVVPNEVVLDQAKSALWWLCVLGGVGSKARKGFGNFKHPPQLDPIHGARFVTKGKELRAACGLPEDGFRPERAGGPALRQMVDLGRRVFPGGNGWVEIPVETPNVWQALDAVGMAAQRFAQARKHQQEKQGLGLPRRIGPPARGQFRRGPGVGDRHASPAHYHLHPEGNQFILRLAAFPAGRLPNLQASEALLEELLRYFAAISNL
jgi:CRISPR-associated protein Cmr6